MSAGPTADAFWQAGGQIRPLVPFGVFGRTPCFPLWGRCPKAKPQGRMRLVCSTNSPKHRKKRSAVPLLTRPLRGHPPQRGGHKNALSPRPAGFTKNSVYFLCKVCYTIISVRRDGQTRAEKTEKRNRNAGRYDHLPDDTGSKGMALAAWNWCAFFAHE